MKSHAGRKSGSGMAEMSIGTEIALQLTRGNNLCAQNRQQQMVSAIGGNDNLSK